MYCEFIICWAKDIFKYDWFLNIAIFKLKFYFIIVGDLKGVERTSALLEYLLPLQKSKFFFKFHSSAVE